LEVYISRDIFVTERLSGSFLRRAQAGTAFRNLFYPGIGITNTTPLRPNFGSLFAFRNFFERKIVLYIRIGYTARKSCVPCVILILVRGCGHAAFSFELALLSHKYVSYHDGMRGSALGYEWRRRLLVQRVAVANSRESLVLELGVKIPVCYEMLNRIGTAQAMENGNEIWNLECEKSL
jgi:hypothetical protein